MNKYVRIPYVIVQWSLLAILRGVVVFLGWFIVPAMLKWGDRDTFPIWGNFEGGPPPSTGDGGFWNQYVWYAWRNPAHNAFNLDRPYCDTWPLTLEDPTLEKLSGFQWRYMQSKWLDSFRMTWGEPSNKGKQEFYIGWKMNDSKVASFTFFQLRMKWQSWLLLALVVYAIYVVAT